ncbi:hypothetical protein Daura_36525 [Dactylosporangium aurantiacum]|uniref:Uncharacterized protein n=1 Tax=Dactylosporangium aurantiacum TaxID=35754 RepID=A0A9Q9IAE6_9ACTN|nr:hypothetical protein [Dactylosporangium aurantiacum]MDG6108856.1 hypothetical protein [Dactylosporangium aurantiacum]UWZ52156.1 hypothetical protein Daura_36525 [Dactylosporangium aurantiacum]
MTGLLAVEVQLRLVGAVLVGLGVGHVALPRVLAWRPQFAGLRPLTRQVLYTHTFFIGVMCVLLGLAPLLLAADLLAPGRVPAAVLGAECVFWGLRWGAQFVAFPPATWRGSRLHRAGYAGFTLLWTWIVAVFAAALLTR